jgi:hypothetical protein
MSCGGLLCEPQQLFKEDCDFQSVKCVVYAGVLVSNTADEKAPKAGIDPEERGGRFLQKSVIFIVSTWCCIQWDIQGQNALCLGEVYVLGTTFV